MSHDIVSECLRHNFLSLRQVSSMWRHKPDLLHFRSMAGTGDLLRKHELGILMRFKHTERKVLKHERDKEKSLTGSLPARLLWQDNRLSRSEQAQLRGSPVCLRFEIERRLKSVGQSKAILFVISHGIVNFKMFFSSQEVKVQLHPCDFQTTTR